MTLGASGGDDSGSTGSTYRDLRLAELVAFGLLLVEGLVILGFVAAAIANRAQFGGEDLAYQGAHAWGSTLSLATVWASPESVAIFLLVPLALVAWIGRQDGDEVAETRTRAVLRLELVLAVLTIAGGTLAVVGRVMQFPPSQPWSSFLFTLGGGVGSVCLGVLGIVVIRWLAIDLHADLFTRGGKHDVASGPGDQ